MFENLTYTQLTELRAALWVHYDTAYAEHSAEVQQLEIGTEAMDEAFKKWADRRNDIKAAQNAVDTAIRDLEKRISPKPLRRRIAE